MKMFTAKEEKNLAYVLSKTADSASALLLEELHGLLFGIVITPEPVMPDEWLSVIFDEETQFDDDQDAEVCAGHLMKVYNRMINDSSKGKLAFPFNYEKLTDSEHSLIEGWTYGLFLGLSLRPHIWGLSEEFEGMDDEAIPDDIQDLINSCSIITAIALPEEMEEIFETEPGQPLKDPAELEEALYAMLPLAVEHLQQHSANLRKLNAGIKTSMNKIGRNDPCPCGSGKKYKKCCGND